MCKVWGLQAKNCRTEHQTEGHTGPRSILGFENRVKNFGFGLRHPGSSMIVVHSLGSMTQG